MRIVFSYLWVTEHYKVAFNHMLKTMTSAYVLVHLGHCNEMLQTRWLINNKYLLPTVPAAGSLRPRHCKYDFWWEPTSWFMAFLPCLPLWRKGSTLVSSVPCKGTSSIHEGSPLVTWSPPEAPCSNTVPCVLRGLVPQCVDWALYEMHSIFI